MEARFPGLKWDMGMEMSGGADEMIGAARAVWLTIVWLVCYDCLAHMLDSCFPVGPHGTCHLLLCIGSFTFMSPT